jgi:pterin-4a-carbinolamine dehydratase
LLCSRGTLGARNSNKAIDISFGWDYTAVFLRTKKIKGLHENDFIMAGRLDRLFNRERGG